MRIAIREGTKALRAWLATYSVYTYVHARSYVRIQLAKLRKNLSRYTRTTRTPASTYVRGNSKVRYVR